MSQQHIQQHHQQPTQYVHYSAPSSHLHQTQSLQQQHPITHIAPQDTQHQQIQHQQHQHQQTNIVNESTGQIQQPPQASGSGSQPLIARGDWTKDLVQLAKTAELKKHALTLQLHTAHILSAHASLEQKAKAIEDLKEQKNKLESERTRLLNSLREINEDRDRVDLMQASLEKECNDTRAKIDTLTKTDYAVAKADVDRLRAELGQPPLPSLQSTLEEKTTQYLNDRRLNGNANQSQPTSQMASSTAVPARSTPVASTAGPSGTTQNNKRSASSSAPVSHDGQVKRPRGRPKGSKNKNKTSE